MVRNLCSPSSGREVANQFAITTKNGTFFQSYSTLIAKLDTKGKVTLSSDWNYSNTTSKYLHVFLKEYCGYYGQKLSASFIMGKIKDGTFKYVETLTM